MDDVTAAQIMIKCLDLTSLNETDTEEDIIDLCRHAVTPYGNTAAVCIYPKFLPLALRQISQNIRIATVVNFPAGLCDGAKTEKEISRALKAGADEIDAVFPYHDFLQGNIDKVTSFLLAVRNACQDHTLKIILESGELQTTVKIKEASMLAIEAGADFIKTSTGKSAVSATPEAANAMLEAIKASGKNVGFKASGGIKTTDDAKKYLVLAQSIMGPEWVTPAHFRLGASSLLNSLSATVTQGY